MPKIKRITRRDIRKNELVDVVQKIAFFVKHNPREVLIGCGIFGGSLVFLWIVLFLIKRQIDIPKEEFTSNLFNYHSGGNPEALKQQFISYREKHKGKLSLLAWVYKGVAEKKLGEYATATETFSSFLKKNKNHYLSSACLINLGNIEEEKGNFKKAIDYYKEAMAKNDYLSDYAKKRIKKLNVYIKTIGTPTAIIP